MDEYVRRSKKIMSSLATVHYTEGGVYEGIVGALKMEYIETFYDEVSHFFEMVKLK